MVDLSALLTGTGDPLPSDTEMLQGDACGVVSGSSISLLCSMLCWHFSLVKLVISALVRVLTLYSLASPGFRLSCGNGYFFSGTVTVTLGYRTLSPENSEMNIDNPAPALQIVGAFALYTLILLGAGLLALDRSLKIVRKNGTIRWT